MITWKSVDILGLLAYLLRLLAWHHEWVISWMIYHVSLSHHYSGTAGCLWWLAQPSRVVGVLLGCAMMKVGWRPECVRRHLGSVCGLLSLEVVVLCWWELRRSWRNRTSGSPQCGGGLLRWSQSKCINYRDCLTYCDCHTSCYQLLWLSHIMLSTTVTVTHHAINYCDCHTSCFQLLWLSHIMLSTTMTVTHHDINYCDCHTSCFQLLWLSHIMLSTTMTVTHHDINYCDCHTSCFQLLWLSHIMLSTTMTVTHNDIN